jgi:hypothetical protein
MNVERMATFAVAGMAMVCVADEPLSWPEIGRESKPWAYNWWPGSAVDAQSISNEFRRYAEGGLGGVHVIPIYGAKGVESRYVDFLSPKWMALFACASETAKSLGLGVDMTTGSGWCFGGPQVTPERGGWTFSVKVFETHVGEAFTNTLHRQTLQGLQAVGSDGATIDLLSRVDAQGRLDWKPPVPGVKVVALSAQPAKGPAVKRAGPGGKGLMINPFDPAAMTQFLVPFSQAFPVDGQGPKPRAMYHDSYEYYGTSWCDGFLAAFERTRGYRLTDELAAFAGLGDPDRVARVKSDYRETLSDLMVEDVFPQWTAWCRARGILTRNEAHGAPANLLDLYALADIPETEMFGHGGADPLVSRYDADFGKADRNPFIAKMASSSAHVKGTRLASAEFGTWMAEHFHETPEEIKCLADLMFLSGINHLFYHGTCFSADDAAWPGWLFYASTEMNPRNPIWHDAPLLNGYLARTQAILQSGKPANDVLLYWPIHDFWNTDGPYVRQLTVHDSAWMTNQPLGRTSASLWQKGIGFDYVSDRLLDRVQVADGKLVTVEGATYSALMVPASRLMPSETFERVVRMAAAGANIVFCDQMPSDVPGWGGLSKRRARFEAARAALKPLPTAAVGVTRATVGKGAVHVGRGDAALELCGVRRELSGVQVGVRCIRRRHAEGYHYLIVNHGTKCLDGWVRLAVPARSVVVLDALTGSSGVAESRAEAGGGGTEVRLYLEPASSVLLRTFDTRAVAGAPFRFARPGTELFKVPGPWQVRFVAGGPELPKACEASELASWTENGDPETVRFGGTAVYRTAFDAPAACISKPIILDLGRVEVSARVRLNGAEIGPVIMTPYRLLMPQGLRAGHNELEVEVTNLGANRIRDLDVRKVPWRIFQDINFVDIRYKGFDARQWPVRDSGLLGPVRLLECQE